MYTNRWYKGYYLTANGTIATSQMVSENVYVNEEGRKCAKEEVRLGKLKKKLQSTVNGYSGNWSVYVENLKTGDILISSELSRLGRNLLQVMSILHFCMKKDIQVWTIKDNYRLGADIQSKVLAFAFGLSAEIERNLISQRTKEALARLKAEGKRLGRPKGSSNKFAKLSGKEEKIAEMLRENMSKKKIAQFFHVSRRTLYNFIKKQQISGNK